MSADNHGGTLSDEQMHALTSVLDLIIPESDDGLFPAAGQLGVAHYICEQAPESLPIVAAGLAALERSAKDRDASAFVALPVQERIELLGEIDAGEPAFLPTVIFHTYICYYQDARVSAALGLRPGPPFPAGYEVAASDLSILERVRQLPKLYRE